MELEQGGAVADRKAGPLPSEPHFCSLEDGTGGGYQAGGLRARMQPYQPPSAHLGSEAQKGERPGVLALATLHPARPCSSFPFLFLCYHFEKMEHDLLSLFKKCC